MTPEEFVVWGTRYSLEQAALELKDDIHNLEELEKGGEWDIKDAGYVDITKVADKRRSKLEELDELVEQIGGLRAVQT